MRGHILPQLSHYRGANHLESILGTIRSLLIHQVRWLHPKKHRRCWHHINTMSMKRTLPAKVSKVMFLLWWSGLPFSYIFRFCLIYVLYCVGSAKSSILTNNNLQGCTVISKLGASKVEVLKKPSKFLKTSLVGLINDKRSKVWNHLWQLLSCTE